MPPNSIQSEFIVFLVVSGLNSLGVGEFIFFGLRRREEKYRGVTILFCYPPENNNLKKIEQKPSPNGY